MVKPTSEQIDAQIVDRAAGLFARHGFENTSVQQIADATGYSKAGILRRFAAKDALYEAAIAAISRAVTAVTAEVEALPEGEERDQGLIAGFVDLTFQWPGVSTLSLGLIDIEPNDAPAELLACGEAVTRAFGIDWASSDEERQIRVISAAAVLTHACLTAVRVGREREWRPTIIATALDALGH